MASFRPRASFPTAKFQMLWVAGHALRRGQRRALRASAFANRGMRGVGWVYDQYVAGKITSFDEIAAIYDPLCLRNISVPLVNIRFWLDGLIAASRITPDDARNALEELRRLPVFDRDIVSIKKCLHGLFHQNAVQKELDTMTAFPDIKRNDARKLLGLLASISTSGAQDDCDLNLSRDHG